MPTFPSTLPRPSVNSFKESPPNNLIRSSVDKGVDIVRRRTSASPRPVSFRLTLTPAQITTLDNFYVTTLASGALTFTYTHPRTNVAVTARFVSQPEYTEREGVLFDADLSLEILP